MVYVFLFHIWIFFYSDLVGRYRWSMRLTYEQENNFRFFYNKKHSSNGLRVLIPHLNFLLLGPETVESLILILIWSSSHEHEHFLFFVNSNMNIYASMFSEMSNKQGKTYILQKLQKINILQCNKIMWRKKDRSHWCRMSFT